MLPGDLAGIMAIIRHIGTHGIHTTGIIITGIIITCMIIITDITGAGIITVIPAGTISIMQADVHIL